MCVIVPTLFLLIAILNMSIAVDNAVRLFSFKRYKENALISTQVMGMTMASAGLTEK
jgi:hypothetical protein